MAKRLKYSDWETDRLKFHLEEQGLVDGEGGPYPTEWLQRLFPEYAPTGGEGGSTSWNFNRGMTDAGGTPFYDVPDLRDRINRLGGNSAIGYDPQSELLAMQRLTGNGGYFVPDAEGFMYVPDTQGSWGLFDQFLGAFKPLAMTAGIGMGLNAMAGAAGLGAAGGASAGGGAAAGGSGLGSGITAGSSASGIGGGSLGTGLIPGTASTSIGGGALGSGIGAGAGSAATAAGLAGAGALAPGFFSAESATPLAGGGSAMIGGGDALAPSGTGIGGTGITWGTLANGIPGLLGALASSEQADAYSDAANQYMSYGAPSRQRFEASYAPGFSMENDPGYKDAMEQAAKAAMRALSVNGNPANSPNAWGAALQDLYQKNAYNALQEYRRMNAGAGGMAALTSAAPSMTGNAIQSQGGVYGGLGAAAADIFNPPKSLAQILKEMKVTL